MLARGWFTLSLASMTLANSILLLVPAALQGWLLVVLKNRRLQQSFPFFYAYNVFSVVALVVRFTAQPSYRTYFIAYWTTEAAYAVFGLLATFELFPHVFKIFTRVRQFRLLIFAAVLLMITLSILHAIFKPAIQAGTVVATIVALEISVRYVQAGIFVLIVAMAAFYALPLRRYALGIVSGFGLVAAGRLAAMLLRSEYGTRFNFLFTNMPPVIYVIAVVIWLITFLRPEPPDPLEQIKSPLSPEQVIERIRKLTKALKGERHDFSLLASRSGRTASSSVPSFQSSARSSTAHHP